MSYPMILRTMPEAALLRTLTDACDVAGLLWYHREDRRRCSRCGNFDRPADQPGLPDLLVVQPPVLRAYELKTERGVTTLMQREWVAQLGRCIQVDARVVKPRHLDVVLATLAER